MLSFNSSNIVSKTRTIGRRMFLVSSFKAIVVVGILGRLAALQINQFQKYSGLSDKNRFRETQIAPPRGIIQDYFGKEIASNEKIYQLHITPEDVPNIDTLFFKLKNIINLTEEKVFLLKRRMAKQKRWDTLIIADNLTWSEFSRVNLFLHELSGLRPVVSIARVYSDNASAHVVGYVSEVTPRDLKNKAYLQDLRIKEVAVGKTGLESLYDQQMFGTPGYLRFEVNAYGKKIKQVSTNNGEKGKTYRTTLDQDIQVHAADLIKDVSGAVCVMDIYNGDIVSMVSSPAFNPNAFVHGIDEQNWKDLISHRGKPLLNKAISGLYPPGSTIKTLTALCALENDVFTTKLNVECTGYIELYGERFHCWKKECGRCVCLLCGLWCLCADCRVGLCRLLCHAGTSVATRSRRLMRESLMDSPDLELCECADYIGCWCACFMLLRLYARQNGAHIKVWAETRHNAQRRACQSLALRVRAGGSSGCVCFVCCFDFVICGEVVAVLIGRREAPNFA